MDKANKVERFKVDDEGNPVPLVVHAYTADSRYHVTTCDSRVALARLVGTCSYEKSG